MSFPRLGKLTDPLFESEPRFKAFPEPREAHLRFPGLGSCPSLEFEPIARIRVESEARACAVYVTPFMEHHLREFAREAYVSLAFINETEAFPHRRAVLTFHRGGYDMKMPNFLVPFVHSSLLKNTTEDVSIVYKKDKMGWHPWLLRAQSKVIECVRGEDRSCGAEAGLYPLSTMFGYESKGKYGEWREESMVFAAFDEAVLIARGTKSRLDAAAGKAHAAAHHNFNPNLI